MATTITANGINFPDGSAGSPSIGGSDTNTGLFTGSDIVGFATGGSERLRIDASGNVNIANDSGKLQLGTSADLQISHDGSNSIINDNGTGSLRIQTAGTNHWEFGDSFLKGNDNRKIILGDGSDLQIYHDGSNSYVSHDNGSGHLYLQGDAIKLRTRSATGNEDYIVCNESGSVDLYHNNSKRLETTSDGISTHSSFQGTGSPGVIHAKTGGGSTNQVFVGCSANNTDFCGGLRRDGAALSVELFNGSDRRIKNNIAPMPSVLNKLNQIELKTYNYKNDNTASGRGPIAQDLINVFPEKVVKTDDGTGDTLPSDVEPWSIGNNFTWELIKAVQELSAKVETLETKVAALEAA